MVWTRLVNFGSNPRNRRILYRAGAVLTLSSGAAYYWPEISFTGRTIHRASRTIVSVIRVSLDYKNNYPVQDSPEAQVLRSLVHQRAAKELLSLFEKNGGVYIKVGQHLSTLEYIIPVEYCQALASLHNRAPQSSMGEVAMVLHEELGKSINELYTHFDATPIGAASLAQVHRAIRRDTGQEVAVKVQHARLQGFVESDIFVIGSAVRAVKWAFPEFDFDWIADEMRINLPRELDFQAEGRNAERLLRHFRQLGKTPLEGQGSIVRIPQVFWDQTTKRVLTMEYLPGAKATDRLFLRENQIDPREVSALITRSFSEMIFMHGFVHCDPHPGNLLIRPRKARPFCTWLGRRPFELVLIDHGLYRELPDEFRLAYSGLWKAVIDADEASMRKYAESIGGGEAYRLFSCILTQRSWNSISSGDIMFPRTPAEAAEIIHKAPAYLGQVADLLAHLPRPLLLLLKTNDLLRHLERQLTWDLNCFGQTFTIMAHYCIDALYEGRSLRTRLIRIYYHLCLNLLETMLYFKTSIKNLILS